MLDAWGRPATLDEARRLPLIGYEEAETLGVQAAWARPWAWTWEPADFVFRTDNDVAQLRAIRAGLGLGICQVGLALRDPMLERVLDDCVQLRPGDLCGHPRGPEGRPPRAPGLRRPGRSA
ncbi:hypothetical protein ACRAWD_28915 [Caulobacter segnis]